MSENLKTLTKSFSETVLRMASVVALANEALRPLIDDESSTRITRSFGDVDAVTYQAEVLKSYISRELRGLCHTDDSSSGGQAIAANVIGYHKSRWPDLEKSNIIWLCALSKCRTKIDYQLRLIVFELIKPKSYFCQTLIFLSILTITYYNPFFAGSLRLRMVACHTFFHQ